MSCRAKAEFKLGRPAISEHLQVLRLAKLVREERRGRAPYDHLRAKPLEQVSAWLPPFERFWRTKLDALRRQR